MFNRVIIIRKTIKGWVKEFFKSQPHLFLEVILHCSFSFSFLFLFFFLGPHLWHMKVPRLGDELELQLPAYAVATATLDPSFIFDLHHSSWQC